MSERSIAHGVAAYARAGIRVEAAAGAALAALELVAAPDPVVVIVSGANIDDAAVPAPGRDTRLLRPLT